MTPLLALEHVLTSNMYPSLLPSPLPTSYVRVLIWEDLDPFRCFLVVLRLDIRFLRDPIFTGTRRVSRLIAIPSCTFSKGPAGTFGGRASSVCCRTRCASSLARSRSNRACSANCLCRLRIELIYLVPTRTFAAPATATAPATCSLASLTTDRSRRRSSLVGGYI